MRRLWLGLRALLFPRRVERELEDEMQFHLDMHVEQLVRRGMTETAARDAARRSFGNRGRHKEHARAVRYSAPVEHFLRDLAYAGRSLWKRPGFTAIAVLVLALGIGANTTIFSAVNAVLLREPSYGDADRLAFIWQTRRTATGRLQVPAPDLIDFRVRDDVFQGVAFAANATDGMLRIGDQAEHARIGVVSSSLFDVLRVPPALGRTFDPREGEISAASLADSTFVPPPSVAILSYGLWLTRFGGDSGVVGRSVTVNGQMQTVVGVLPKSFTLRTPPDVGFATDVDLWTPLRVDVSLFRRVDRRRDLDSDNTGIAIARLMPGATFGEAQSAMDALAAQQRELIPAYREAGTGISVAPLAADLAAYTKPALLALQGAVGIVLLIACMNVATMLAARGSSRRRELAVRSALGASRSRLMRQLLTETLMIAIVAGVLGVGMAALMTPTVAHLSAVALPAETPMSVNAAVLGFSVLLSVITAIVAGVVPAMVHSARQGADSLRERDSSGDPIQTRFGRALVTVQIALSVALLAGAGLLLKSFAELQRVNPGFDPDRLITFDINLSSASLRGPADRALFVRDIERRVRALPGVEAVGLTNAIPLSGVEWTQPYGLDGETEAEWERNSADFRMITSQYFEALGVRLLAGRAFTPEEDVSEHERVAIVDAALANKIDPAGAVIGRRIGFPLDGAPIWAEIVGVVDRVRHSSLLHEGRETVYVPYRQEASRSVALAVRTSRDVESAAAEIRRELHSLDVNVPVFDFALMETRVHDALAPNRFVLFLVAVFAAIAIVLAASGLYGLLSYAVNQRTRELGVRLALGAGQSDVVSSVLRNGMVLVAAGLVAGIPVSLFTSRALNSLLYSVTPGDHFILVGVTVVLSAVALLACYIPAQRASRVDPMVALRLE
jgi:putative ABC transport system permease protein